MMRSRLIAVIGCIGSGKTTLLKFLGEEFPVFNADILAREVLETKRAELVARYGSEICLPNRTQDAIGYSPENDGRSCGQNFEHRCEQTCKLNKAMLAAILFQDDDNFASEERRWIAELVNDDVLALIVTQAAAAEDRCGIGIAEITAPTAEFLRVFDGIIVSTADEDTAIWRTNDRENAWSEARRRKIYRMQMENIYRCIEEYISCGAEEYIACGAEEIYRSPSNFATSETVSEISKFVLRADNSKSEDIFKKTAENIVRFLKKQ